MVNESHGKKSDESHFHVLIVSEASDHSQPVQPVFVSAFVFVVLVLLLW